MPREHLAVRESSSRLRGPEVLGVNVEGVSPGVRAKRGEHLPVVLSIPGDRRVVGGDVGDAAPDHHALLTPLTGVS